MEGEATITKTKAGRATNTRKPSPTKQSQARPASETTDVKSLLDVDISSEASDTAISTASSPTLGPASPPASSSASKRSSFTWGRKSSSTLSRVPTQPGDMITSLCGRGCCAAMMQPVGPLSVSLALQYFSAFVMFVPNVLFLHSN